MDIQILRKFLAVANAGSITKAYSTEQGLWQVLLPCTQVNRRYQGSAASVACYMGTELM